MMIAISIMILIGLIGLFYKLAAGDYKRLFWLALIFKISMAVALGLVYLHYYTANDTWLFFQDATALTDYAREDFGSYLRFLWNNDVRGNDLEIFNMQERSLFLVKIISGFALIGSNNYWVTSIYFSLFSFFASWNLFKIINRNFEGAGLASALALLFFPSVVFWSSGLVKETFALAGIYFITIVFIKVIRSDKPFWWEWIVALVAFYAAWNLKYYWAASFMAVVTTSLLIFFLQGRVAYIKRNSPISWSVLFLILLAVASLLHPNFYLSRFLDVLITNHNDFLRISRPDGLIHYYNLTATWWSVFINSPWALMSGLFRPFIWEAAGLTSLLASIENLFLVILVIASLFRKWATEYNLLSLSVVGYTILLCVFLALSTPNLGTLSRYRTGFLPFFVFIIAYRNPLLSYLSSRVRFLCK